MFLLFTVGESLKHHRTSKNTICPILERSLFCPCSGKSLSQSSHLNYKTIFILARSAMAVHNITNISFTTLPL